MSDVLTFIEGKVGRIRLNRPKAIHALTTAMCAAVLDATVDGIIGSAFGAAGQRCMAGSVVVTVGEAHEKLMLALVAATERLSVGDGLDESVDVGPVVSCSARDRIAGWIERAVEEGATLAVDGRAAAEEGTHPDGSSFVGPTQTIHSLKKFTICCLFSLLALR